MTRVCLISVKLKHVYGCNQSILWSFSKTWIHKNLAIANYGDAVSKSWTRPVTLARDSTNDKPFLPFGGCSSTKTPLFDVTLVPGHFLWKYLKEKCLSEAITKLSLKCHYDIWSEVTTKVAFWKYPRSDLDDMPVTESAQQAKRVTSACWKVHSYSVFKMNLINNANLYMINHAMHFYTSEHSGARLFWKGKGIDSYSEYIHTCSAQNGLAILAILLYGGMEHLIIYNFHIFG